MRLEELAQRMNSLIGEQVVTKLITGNAISLWFSVPSSDPAARGIWIEPPWRIEAEAGVETSSYGFPSNREPGETHAEYRARFVDACARSDRLKDNRLAAIDIDFFTGDLVLHFADERVLRSFATDTDWEVWHYEDVAAGCKYRVSGRFVEVEQGDA